MAQHKAVVALGDIVRRQAMVNGLRRHVCSPRLQSSAFCSCWPAGLLLFTRRVGVLAVAAHMKPDCSPFRRRVISDCSVGTPAHGPAGQGGLLMPIDSRPPWRRCSGRCRYMLRRGIGSELRQPLGYAHGGRVCC